MDINGGRDLPKPQPSNDTVIDFRETFELGY